MAGWSLPCGGDAGCRVKQDPHHSRRQQTQPRDRAGKTETHLNEATNRWSRGEDEGRDGGGGWWELGIDVGEILGRLRSLCAKNRKKRSPQQPMLPLPRSKEGSSNCSHHPTQRVWLLPHVALLDVARGTQGTRLRGTWDEDLRAPWRRPLCPFPPSPACPPLHLCPGFRSAP